MSPQPLPAWVTWWQRPFPGANTLLLHGRRPALVEGGFVGHAEESAAWVRAHVGDIDLVVNTHWHCDHVGGNALLQARGAAIAAGAPEAEAIGRRDPGCCAAEYLDQSGAPYTVDVPLDDGQVLRLGEADWGWSAPLGHLALWQPEERLRVVGDALSDYDVGWVNLALDGPEAAATALPSLKRLADPGAVLAAALRRSHRLVDGPAPGRTPSWPTKPIRHARSRVPAQARHSGGDSGPGRPAGPPAASRQPGRQTTGF